MSRSLRATFPAAFCTLLYSLSSSAQTSPPDGPSLPPPPVVTDAPPVYAPPPPAEPPMAEPPLAGWHGGLFYLRDQTDNFRLYLQGRAQIDTYAYFGPGVPDTRLKATTFLRRVRPELSGEFLGRWQWMLAGDFVGGTAPLDNPNGNAGADGQTVGIRAQATDVFLNYRADKIFNLQVGQFDAPFTMENRTSDKYIQFMERSLAVRALGIPTNKEVGAMVWGETANREFYYSLGVFNGEGQNRPNVDTEAELMGRVFTRPVTSGPLKDFQIGGSFRYGGRNSSFVYYNYPNMTTQGNYTFWRSSAGNIRILPSGIQEGFAGELRIPIMDMIDLTGEFVYVKNGTREAIDGQQARYTERKGDLKGYGYYLQLGFWPLGNRDINGQPGYSAPAHIDFRKKDPETPPRALQLLVKWEQLNATYSSASRTNTANAATDGDIKVNAFSLGANYWASKHIRLTLNYMLYMFPDSVQGGNAAQRAVAPGNTLGAGINDDARQNAHAHHELAARFGVAF